MSTVHQIERTECACAKCRIGCTTMPGTLAPSDLHRLAEHFGSDPETFAVERLHASDGIKAVRQLSDGTLAVVQIPTLVPRLVQDEDGAERCTFLDGERCSVHAVAPFGCSHFDQHMSAAEADSRSKLLAMEILRDAQDEASEYAAVHATLIASGHVAPPLAERRKRYAEAKETKRAK